MFDISKFKKKVSKFLLNEDGSIAKKDLIRIGVLAAAASTLAPQTSAVDSIVSYDMNHIPQPYDTDSPTTKTTSLHWESGNAWPYESGLRGCKDGVSGHCSGSFCPAHEVFYSNGWQLMGQLYDESSCGSEFAADTSAEPDWRRVPDHFSNHYSGDHHFSNHVSACTSGVGQAPSVFPHAQHLNDFTIRAPNEQGTIYAEHSHDLCESGITQVRHQYGQNHLSDHVSGRNNHFSDHWNSFENHSSGILGYAGHSSHDSCS